MARSERLRYIREIEKQRSSRILVFITGDRRGLETRIATDVFPFILNHLMRMGRQKTIDLYLYSTGGITMAGYALVNLIKEFCDSFNVIIPFKAQSCATLIALGANNIIMTRMGQLSPIDPSVQSPLGPQAPISGAPGGTQTIPINVEDAVSYLDLAKQLGLKEEESIARVFDRLSASVHPLALGSVNRVREQIGFLAKTLLAYHVSDPDKIREIVDTITKRRFSHDYLIGRKEAKEVLGLPVIDISADFEQTIMRLYGEYDRLLQISVPYHPEIVLGASDTPARGVFDRAIVESDDLTHVFRTSKEVSRVTLTPPQVPTPTLGYLERILREEWLEDNNI